MAYEPKEWACGEVVTADALNHIEQGIAEASGSTEPLIVNDVDGTLDKTWQQIYDAFLGGQMVILSTSGVQDSTDHVPLIMISTDFYVEFGGSDSYHAASANDYPQTS